MEMKGIHWTPAITMGEQWRAVANDHHRRRRTGCPTDRARKREREKDARERESEREGGSVISAYSGDDELAGRVSL